MYFDVITHILKATFMQGKEGGVDSKWLTQSQMDKACSDWLQIIAIIYFLFCCFKN